MGQVGYACYYHKAPVSRRSEDNSVFVDCFVAPACQQPGGLLVFLARFRGGGFRIGKYKHDGMYLVTLSCVQLSSDMVGTFIRPETFHIPQIILHMRVTVPPPHIWHSQCCESKLCFWRNFSCFPADFCL